MTPLTSWLRNILFTVYNYNIVRQHTGNPCTAHTIAADRCFKERTIIFALTSIPVNLQYVYQSETNSRSNLTILANLGHTKNHQKPFFASLFSPPLSASLPFFGQRCWALAPSSWPNQGFMKLRLWFQSNMKPFWNLWHKDFLLYSSFKHLKLIKNAGPLICANTQNLRQQARSCHAPRCFWAPSWSVGLSTYEPKNQRNQKSSAWYKLEVIASLDQSTYTNEEHLMKCVGPN